MSGGGGVLFSRLKFPMGGGIVVDAIIGAYAGYFIVLGIVAIGLDVAVGKYAVSRGKPFKRYFWFAFFLSPLISFIILLAESSSKTRPEVTAESSDMTKCPYCAEQIKLEAKICKHCGSDVANHIAKLLEERAAENTAQMQRLEQAARLAKKEEERIAREAEEVAMAAKAARKAFWKSGKGKTAAAALAVVVVLGGYGTFQAIQTSAAKSAAEEKAKQDQIALEQSRLREIHALGVSIVESAKSSLSLCLDKYPSAKRGNIYTDFDSIDNYQMEINGIRGTRVNVNFSDVSYGEGSGTPELAVINCAADLITGVKGSLKLADSGLPDGWTLYASSEYDFSLEKFIEP